MPTNDEETFDTRGKPLTAEDFERTEGALGRVPDSESLIERSRERVEGRIRELGLEPYRE